MTVAECGRQIQNHIFGYGDGSTAPPGPPDMARQMRVVTPSARRTGPRPEYNLRRDPLGATPAFRHETSRRRPGHEYIESRIDGPGNPVAVRRSRAGGVPERLVHWENLDPRAGLRPARASTRRIWFCRVYRSAIPARSSSERARPGGTGEPHVHERQRAERTLELHHVRSAKLVLIPRDLRASPAPRASKPGPGRNSG